MYLCRETDRDRERQRERDAERDRERCGSGQSRVISEVGRAEDKELNVRDRKRKR